ncbi:class II peroxidase [Didymella exigua CBS 183.55]|uniref:Peroxidase n=1 Tax=Didymella exigua CBS 183.55 TaxID=1150837 RepID=A0A6A5RG43_9PLEO|nr:class II peroxidase [Didymella exigua CBS 183.55]KAF1926712.1 class II peroxidase [Didymella exigua CBS 183.55]
MYISHIFVTALAAASTAQAFSIQEEAHNANEVSKRTLGNLLSLLSGLIGGNKQSTACPAVWNQISTQLTEQFLADGQCTDAARAAIRSSFHDCFNGACDGSLILADECSNQENRGLERLCGNLKTVQANTGVGMADLIQFAAAHGVKTCPGGPTVPVKVGRKDSSIANALGVLPNGQAQSGDLIKLFASKGFSPVDLAALLGAHTAAKQRVTAPESPEDLDSTVGRWDNKYFSETRSGKAPFTLPSDKSVAQNPLTMIPFNTFALSKGAWDVAFVSAMQRMSMLGVNQKGLIDCTSALPGGSRKRDVRNSNLFDRLKW